MKRFVKLTLVGCMALAMMAGTSLASEIDIDREGAPAFNFGVLDTAGTTNGAVTVETRWVQAAAFGLGIDFGNSASWPNTAAAGRERAIGYYSSVALQTDSTLKFTVTGAVIEQDATLFLLAYDTATQAYVTVGTLNDFTVSGNGYSSARFQIGAIGADVPFLLKDGTAAGPHSQNVLPANVVCVLSKGSAIEGYDGLRFIINPGFFGNVTIALSEAKDNNNNQLVAPLAGAENILSVGNYFGALIRYVAAAGLTTGPATSTINVESITGPPAFASRTSFVDEGRTAELVGADTDELNSEAAVSVYNSAEYGLNLTANDTYSLAVKRGNVAGVAGVTVGGAAATTGVNQWTYANNFAGLNLTTPRGIDIRANGTTILQTGTWQVDLSVKLVQDALEPAALGTIALLSNANSHVWDINGSVFIVPFNSTVAKSQVQINVTNTSNVDAEVMVDVVTVDPAISAEGVSVGTVPAGSMTVFSATDIWSMVSGLPGFVDYKGSYFLRFTAIAPNNSIHAAAIQIINKTGERNSIPVLTDEKHDWKE